MHKRTLAIIMGSILSFAAPELQGQRVIASSVSAFRAPSGLPILAKVLGASAKAGTINSVIMIGSVIAYLGSEPQTGEIKLSGDSDGERHVVMTFGRESREEFEPGFKRPRGCTWTDKGVTTAGQQVNCWRSATWFFPQLEAQPASPIGALEAADFGTGNQPAPGSDLIKLRLTRTTDDTKAAAVKLIQQSSEADLYVDPKTDLPEELRYRLSAEGKRQGTLLYKVKYSDYRPTPGGMAPFHIQRFVNGALQLDITLTTVTIV